MCLDIRSAGHRSSYQAKVGFNLLLGVLIVGNGILWDNEVQLSLVWKDHFKLSTTFVDH